MPRDFDPPPDIVDLGANPYQAPLAYSPPGNVALPPFRDVVVVPWHWWHIVVAAFLCVGGSVVGTTVVAAVFQIPVAKQADLAPNQWQSLILGAGLGSLAGLVLSIAFVRASARATWQELGWVSHTWPRDVQLGGISFLALMIPIYGLQLLLNLLYQRWIGDPPQHPLIEHLQANPGGGAFLVAAFTAVVAAPLTEEFLFRAVLQGWLQKIALVWRVDRMAAHGPATSEELVFVAWNRAPLLVWPILVSAALFSAAHWSHGVAWIPLFFLGLALGYLYQRTGNLIASITLHMCLNAFSTAMLYLSTAWS